MKWFIRCMAVLAVVLGVISLTLAYLISPGRSNESVAAKTTVRVEAAAPANDPPFAVLKPVVSVKGQEVDPFDFLDTATPSNVVAFFAGDAEFNSAGINEIPLILNDGSKRGEVTASLYIIEAEKAVKREAGVAYAPLTAMDFIANENILPAGLSVEAELITDLSRAEFYETGNYAVELTVDGVTLNSTLSLVDTVAPNAKAVSVTVNLGTPVAPMDFVTDVSDASAFQAYFLAGEEPDVFLSGERDVSVILTDDYGNSATVNAALMVMPNIEPPRFSGLRDLEALLNDPVIYRRGVTAVDSFGNELEFEVDSTAVDISAPGDYPVTYSTADADGHSYSQTVNIRVVNVSEDAITEKLDAVMNAIITEGMTQREQAQAIFTWVCDHVDYTSDGPKDSVYEGAYRALQYGQGDCFTFYAIAEVMLNRAGIPNQGVTRVESRTRHYWNLVNCDGEGWYHMDTTPLNTQSGIARRERFMFTDGQAASMTERILANTRARDYYTYDKTLHPEVTQ